MINCSIEDEIAWITINRPEKANAYSTDMLQQLERIWTNIENSCTIAILQSTGTKAFCAGADLQEMQAKHHLEALNLYSQQVFDGIARSTVLSIAAIQAPAIAGGFELTLACDLRVIAPHVWFALPEVSLGIIPAAGGCTRLHTLLGPSIATGVILGQQRISGEQALQWGLVHAQADNPQEYATEWAKKLKQFPKDARKLAKQVLQHPSLEQERLAQTMLYAQKHNT